MALTGGDVLAMDWPTFREWFRERWKQGEHMGIIGPTGSGKTTFIGGLFNEPRPLRKYVLVADPKGGDQTLGALKLERLSDWPGEREMDQILADYEKKGLPTRFVMGPGPFAGSHKDAPRWEARLRAAISDSLDGAWIMGGWTYYIDELQVTADRRLLDLSAKVDRLLVSARSKGVSVVAAFQQPKWVTSASLTQPTWMAVGYTRDTDTVNRLAELMGRPKAEIRGALKGLDRYCWLVVGRDPREPLVVTKPNRLGR